MGYTLTEELLETLGRPLPEVDPSVTHVLVDIAPGASGEDRLFLRAVFKGLPYNAGPSLELGRRMQRVAAALRQRVADLDLPLAATVDFVHALDLPNRKRKSA